MTEQVERYRIHSHVTRSKEAVARFQREVEAVAQLSHPNIVTAHDADEAGGVHFFVMEHVDGEDLALGGVGVHPPASARGKLLGRTLESANPLDAKRRLQPLIVHVRIAPVAETGKPVVLGIGEPGSQRASNLCQVEILRRQSCIAVRSQDVKVSILATEVDPPIADRGGSRDRLAKRGLERPYLAVTREGDHVQVSIQAAVNGPIV